jgi:GNAT superfamily N-acetyltransferase
MDGHMKTDWSNEHASLRLAMNPELPAHMERVREVVNVWSDPDHRKHGYATELLKQVTDEADVAGFVLMLQPKEFGRSNGLKQLENWYERFGFVKIQSNPVLMARAPTFKASVTATGYAAALATGKGR